MDCMSNDEFHATREAIDRGDFNQARHHLNNLRMAGEDPEAIDALFERLSHVEGSRTLVNSKLQFYAITCAVVGYCILSIQSPNGWSPVVWGITSLFAIPLIVGIFAGGSVNSPLKSARFWRCFLIASIPMAIYTLVGMYLARSKMQSADNSMDFVIYLFVAIFYGATAGVVAGAAGSMIHTKARSI